MMKSIVKEIMIILLLCIAILFILSVLFYDYNPINKVVPNKIAYSVPENIQEELNEKSIQNTLSIENKVYTIDASDLTIYQKNSSYNPSKENPFASTTNGNTNTDNSGGSDKQNENTNTNVKDSEPDSQVNANISSGETTKPTTGLK